MTSAPAALSLSYVTDQQKGLSRRRTGKGFTYFAPDGRRVRDAATIDRINHLAIPPAWRSVWICAKPQGHLQATGRDAKGRKQHRYHPEFRAWREGEKFEHVLEFGRALPDLRAALEKDRRRQGLPREKVLATIVHLLDTSLIRVGNAEYAAQNKSYGLTTLLNKHVTVAGDELRFVFTGKSGKLWKLRMKDHRVAKVIRAMQDLPGQHLFQYVDESGAAQLVDSADVNDYLRAVSGRDITAKDFRTWAGTVLAGAALTALPAPESAAGAKRAARDVVEQVSLRLGNTPTICRKCYIHPYLFQSFERGDLAERPTRRRRRAGLSSDEAEILTLLDNAKRIVKPRRVKMTPAHGAAEAHA